MSKGRRYIFWDSCVFLSYLEETPGRIEAISSVMEEVRQSSGTKIVTSTLTKVEVAYKKVDGVARLDDDAFAQIDALWLDYNLFELVEFHEHIATLARDLIRTAVASGITRPRSADAVQLATAIFAGASEINSYEPKWINRFCTLVNCPIRPPTPTQYSLPDPPEP